MNRIQTLILLFIFVVFTTIANAENMTITPYLGLDGQNRHIPYEPNFGNKFFRKDILQANLFFGVKFDKYIAIELGRSATSKRSREIFVNRDSLHLGNISQYDFKDTAIENFREWNINLLAFYPISDTHSIDIIGLLGIANLEVRLKDIKTIEGATHKEIINLKAKKNLIRGGIGLQKMFTEAVGVRTLVIFENTKRFHNISAEIPYKEVAKLKNSIIYGIGIFVKF